MLNVHMSGTYKCPVGWNYWAPAGNTSTNTCMEKDPVTAPDTSSISLHFSLCSAISRCYFVHTVSSNDWKKVDSIK